jgi:DNA-binding Lrp family transcriptional regulator
MISSENFIMVWNVFTKLDSIQKLSPDELYLWCFLYTLRMYDDTVLTNVDLLDQCMILKLFSKKSHINKDGLKNSILELNKKGAIKFSVNDKNFMSNSNTMLKITIQCWGEKDKKRFDKNSDFVGFEMIDFSELYKVKDAIDFYIYVSIKRFDSLGGRDCSDEEWSSLLGVSESTARRRINKLVEDKIIYKRSGKWESDKKQGKNTYSTLPFNEKIEVDIEIDKTEVESDEAEDLSIFDIKIERKIDKINWGNWNDKDKYLDEYDFYLYWLQGNNIEFKVLCDERLRMATNKKSKEKFSMWSTLGENKSNTYWNKIKNDNIMNAVTYDDKSILYLDKGNVDKVNWKNVKNVYYYSASEDDNGKINYTQGVGEFIRLADQSGKVSEEMLSKAIIEYKRIVKRGDRLTMDHINVIRDKVKGK